MLYYYIILLVFGNDISPQVNKEIVACTYFLVFGAILEAILFGGICAEMSKAFDDNKEREERMDYVYFSMQIHSIIPS